MPSDAMSDASMLKPLLVLFPARSGSTLLMQLLGTSPKVVFERSSPFEIRYLSYYLRWAWQWPTPACGHPSGRRAADRSHTDAGQSHRAAAVPDAGRLRQRPVRARCGTDAFRTAWREFCRRARRCESCAPRSRSGGDSTTPRRRARRSLLAAGTRHRPSGDLPAARSARHPAVDLGVQPEARYDLFSRSWKARARRRSRRASSTTAGAACVCCSRWHPAIRDSIVVRYEDMILDLHGVAARLSQRFGVQFDAQQVLSQQKDFAHHMSSKGPQASIGRLAPRAGQGHPAAVREGTRQRTPGARLRDLIGAVPQRRRPIPSR
jgi:hypothetical protein